MAPHSSTLAWKIPWVEEPGGLQSMGLLKLDTTEWLDFHFSLSCIGEGNGDPLQCSCLENPRDGGAWWAAVYGVAQSRTQLKRLSSSSSNTIHYEMVTTQAFLLVKMLTNLCVFRPALFFVLWLFSRAQMSYYLSSSPQNLSWQEAGEWRRGRDSVLLLTFLP